MERRTPTSTALEAQGPPRGHYIPSRKLRRPNFNVCLEFSGDLSQSRPGEVVAAVTVDRRECAAESGVCGRGVGSDQRPEEPVMDFGVEDGDSLSVRGEVVGDARRSETKSWQMCLSGRTNCASMSSNQTALTNSSHSGPGTSCRCGSSTGSVSTGTSPVARNRASCGSFQRQAVVRHSSNRRPSTTALLSERRFSRGSLMTRCSKLAPISLLPSSPLRLNDE